MEFFGMANLMKAALVASDAITTVSPTYAGEIQTDAGGEGLAGLLRSVSFKVSGILNGIDANYWDPNLMPLRLPTTLPKIRQVKRSAGPVSLRRQGGRTMNGPSFQSSGEWWNRKDFYPHPRT